MTRSDKTATQIRPAAVLAATAAALTLLLLLAPTGASAAFEQVGCFAGTGKDQCASVAKEAFGEEVQLGGVSSMAVNRNGAGGVPAGTVYAVRRGAAVAMYYPKTGDGLEFKESWDVTLKETYSRCGPLLGMKEVEGKEVAEHPCKPVPQNGPSHGSIAVDQATGNVYVSGDEGVTAMPMVTVYTPDGSEVITRFGERAPANSTVAESPDKVHNLYLGGIAVDGSGTVYLFDGNFSTFYSRLMVFEPATPGKFDHYEYVGEVLARAGSGTGYPTLPVLDDAGHLYVLSHAAKRIEEFVPQSPAAYPAPIATPICSYEFSKGGIDSIAVNPTNGEVFFYSYKTPKAVRRLGTCDEASGKFAESEPEPLFPEAITPAPERGDLYALAFDPGRVLSPSRPTGALYGAAPGPVPDSGVGTGELGQSSLGYIFGHPEKKDPEVESESVDHVTASAATLRATVNPNGFITTYAFQYLTEAEYEANPPGERFLGASQVPQGGAEISGEPGGKAVATNLSGLLPDTAYRFRAIATSHCAGGESPVCEGAGEAKSFHTYSLETPGLPDHRTWELVSPVQKHGGQVYPVDPGRGSCAGECKPGFNGGSYPRQSTADGDAVTYEGSSFGEVGGAEANSFVAHRTAAGWQTSVPTPPLFAGRSSGRYAAYSPDLARALIEQAHPTLSSSAPAEYANLYSQTIAEPFALEPLLSAAPEVRTPGEPEELVIRYAGSSADLSRVFFEANEVLTPEATEAAPAAPPLSASEFDLYEWIPATGQITLVNVAPGNGSVIAHASFVGAGSAHGTSADGSRVFFKDASGQVYLRIGTAETHKVSDPSPFLAASADGTEAVLKDGCLYDVAGATCTDLTQGEGGFVGIVGQSEDLSHLYFVDQAVLPGAGENSEGDSAQAGKDNLYAWVDGTTSFVATLAPADGGGGIGFDPISDWEPSPARRTAEASPAGRYLAFMSVASLTGYDNSGLCGADPKDNTKPGPGLCTEVFLYDSQTGSLSCPSCNPSGVAPRGRSTLPRIYGGEMFGQSRYLLDNGRLYFDSQDALLLVDTNENVEDVYQHEPQGLGNCERPEGCLSLISSGHEPIDSNFVAVNVGSDGTPGGADVFFTTRDRLVAKDKDELLDLYDAREDGGIPAETELARTECQGEACQPQTSAPNDPTPGSSTFEGAGNVNEAKGKKHAKKHKKKHAKKNQAHKRAAKRNRGGAK
jgi:hypothetical protein